MEKLDHAAALKIFKDTNPTFFKLLKDIPANSMPNIYLVEYEYGVHLADKHNFYYALQGKLTTHDMLPSNIKKDFDGYQQNLPLGMVVEKALEVTIEEPHRTIAAQVYRAGDFFAFENPIAPVSSTYSIPLYTAYSGARSCFSISNLGNETLFAPVKRKLQQSILAPKTLIEHQPFLTALYRKFADNKDWKLKVVYFSYKWIEYFEKDKFIKIKQYLYEQYWIKTEPHRTRVAVDYATSNTFRALVGYKPDPTMVGTIRTFLYLLTSTFPGYAPTTNDEMLPKRELENILMNEYRTTTNPTLIAPEYFDVNKHIYYSLGYPSSMTFSRVYLPQQTAVKRLEELARLMSAFIEQMLSERRFKKSYLGKILPYLEKKYFHTHLKGGVYEKLESSHMLAEYDNRFAGQWRGVEMPKSSPFLRGMISLKGLKNE